MSTSDRLGPNQVRLLRVQPAHSTGDPLICYLKVFEVNHMPAFQALSYTWGSQNTDFNINCDGERKPVTQSCFEALITLRQKGCLFVWIDQLCVDQHNITERGEQVVLMHRIYSRAAGVYIWLGKFEENERPEPHRSSSWKTRLEKNNRLDKGLALFEFLSQHYTHLWPDSAYGEIVPAPTNKAILSDDDAWTALVNIIERAYFTRRWIIQEIASNPDVIVLIGNRQIRWTCIERGCESLQLVRAGFPHGLQISEHHVWQYGQLSDFIYKIYMIHDIRDLFRAGVPMSLGFLLNRCKGFKTKEMQDTIYAVRAIASGNDRFPVPDYNLTPRMICHQHAIELIKTGHVKDVVPYSGSAWQKKSDTDFHELPTWCPDWATDIWPLYYRENKHIQYPRPGEEERAKTVRVSEDGTLLHVRCSFISKVGKTIDVAPNPAKDRFRIRDFVDEHAKYNYMTDSIRDSLKIKPFTNALTGFDWDKIKTIRYSNVDYSIRTFCGEADVLLPNASNGVDLFTRLYQETFFWDISAMYRFSVDTEGLLGLVPETAIPGDDIAFVDGIDSPLILRKVPGFEKGANNAKERYELIGDGFFLDIWPEQAEELEEDKWELIDMC